MSLRMVLLPDPLGPVRNVNSPRPTTNDTSLSAIPVRGYSLNTLANRIMVDAGYGYVFGRASRPKVRHQSIGIRHQASGIRFGHQAANSGIRALRPNPASRR